MEVSAQLPPLGSTGGAQGPLGGLQGAVRVGRGFWAHDPVQGDVQRQNATRRGKPKNKQGWWVEVAFRPWHTLTQKFFFFVRVVMP